MYSIIILPLSAVRWLGFLQESRGDRKNHVPPGATIAVITIFCLSGICNVFLFLMTRPNLLLFKRDINADDRISSLTKVHVFKDSQVTSRESSGASAI